MQSFIYLYIFILSQSCLCVQKDDNSNKCFEVQKMNSRPPSYHDRMGISRAARRGKDFAPSHMEEHAYYAGLILTIHRTHHNKSEQTSSHRNESVCGASLISANRLVTAAHCFWDHRYQTSSLRAVLGARTLQGYGGVSLTTNKVILHPAYDPYNYLLNNIAMVILPVNLYYTTKINPIALPSYTDRLSSVLGKEGTVVGYADNPDSVRVDLNSIRYQATVTFVGQSECRKVYGNIIESSHLCTAGPPELLDPCICPGDSGGPLVIIINSRQVFAGVSIMSNRIGCPKRPPAVYSRVLNFLGFIYDYID